MGVKVQRYAMDSVMALISAGTLVGLYSYAADTDKPEHLFYRTTVYEQHWSGTSYNAMNLLAAAFAPITIYHAVASGSRFFPGEIDKDGRDWIRWMMLPLGEAMLLWVLMNALGIVDLWSLIALSTLHFTGGALGYLIEVRDTHLWYLY